MPEKIIVYRSIAEQRQDEYWMKFLDMNPWLSQGFMYLIVGAAVFLIGYVFYGMLKRRR